MSHSKRQREKKKKRKHNVPEITAMKISINFRATDSTGFEYGVTRMGRPSTLKDKNGRSRTYARTSSAPRVTRQKRTKAPLVSSLSHLMLSMCDKKREKKSRTMVRFNHGTDHAVGVRQNCRNIERKGFHPLRINFENTGDKVRGGFYVKRQAKKLFGR